MTNKRIGSSLRSLFEELDEDVELELLTRKKVLSDQLVAAMKRMNVSKVALAEAMHTSRTVVYRLLDPTDTGVTIETLVKAERALDVRLQLAYTRAPRPTAVTEDRHRRAARKKAKVGRRDRASAG